MKSGAFWLVPVAAVLLGGCLSVRPDREGGGESGEAVRLFPQYRQSVINGADHATCEVYLENRLSEPLTLKAIYLDGKIVQPVHTNNSYALAQLDVCWWQFYPSSNVEARGAAVVQVNFLHSPTTARALEIETADGRRFGCDIPARNYNKWAQLTAITFELDGSKVYVKYEGVASSPARLYLDRRPVDFKPLLPFESTGSGVLMAKPPVKLNNGFPLHVKVEFEDGTRCDALVRVMQGIVWDAYFSTNTAVRKAIAADPIKSVPIRADVADVSCNDLKKSIGYSLAGEIEERSGAFAEDARHLKALDFCTGMFTELWDMYGPLDDACAINPFCFLYGPDKALHLVWESKIVDRGVRAVRPRPAIWVTRFSRGKSRKLAPEEITQLVWMALSQGCKGISFFVMASPEAQQDFLGADPQLTETLLLHDVIERNASLLAPMIPLRTSVIGDAEKGVKETVCWVGDRGLLVILRNLDVTVKTEAEQEPVFTVRPKQQVGCHMKLPPWMPNRVRVKDLITGDPVRFKVDPFRRLAIEVDKLENVRVVWIEADRQKERGGAR